jgi:hypothetical protein
MKEWEQSARNGVQLACNIVKETIRYANSKI